MSDHKPGDCPLGARVETLERQHRSMIFEMAQVHAELRELREHTNDNLRQISGELAHVVNYLSRIETKLNDALMGQP